MIYMGVSEWYNIGSGVLYHRYDGGGIGRYRLKIGMV